MPDSQREMENRQRRTVCVCLFACVSQVSILKESESSTWWRRTPAAPPLPNFSPPEAVFFLPGVSPVRRWRRGEAMRLFPSLFSLSAAHLQLSHPSPETFYSCCEPLMDSFVLPATCNSLSPLLAEGYVARLLFTAFMERESRSPSSPPTRANCAPPPPPSPHRPNRLTHLLEAVGKVGASGAVFARLR